MLLNSIGTGDLDRLTATVQCAAAPTADLIRSIIAACPRLGNLGGKEAGRIARMIESEAWTDAALALIACELPQWRLRRLACDDDQWFCTLSRQPQLPAHLDDGAEGSHTAAALAILDAFLAARRRMLTARATQAPAVPTVRPVSQHVLCCDNFS